MNGTHGFLADGSRIWIPEFFWPTLPGGCRAVAVRGYRYTVAVLDADGRCIGWSDA